MQKLYRYAVFFSGKQQKIVIFAKKFLPDKDLDKYFLRARLAGSTTFSTSAGNCIKQLCPLLNTHFYKSAVQGLNLKQIFSRLERSGGHFYEYELADGIQTSSVSRLVFNYKLWS